MHSFCLYHERLKRHQSQWRCERKRCHWIFRGLHAPPGHEQVTTRSTKFPNSIHSSSQPASWRVSKTLSARTSMPVLQALINTFLILCRKRSAFSWLQRVEPSRLSGLLQKSRFPFGQKKEACGHYLLHNYMVLLFCPLFLYWFVLRLRYGAELFRLARVAFKMFHYTIIWIWRCFTYTFERTVSAMFAWLKLDFTSHRAGTATTASSTFCRWPIWKQKKQKTSWVYLRSKQSCPWHCVQLFFIYKLTSLKGDFLVHVLLPSWSPAASEGDCSTAAGRTPGTPSTGRPPAAPPERTTSATFLTWWT